ncbi:hypothetical protein MY4038_005660 [Beauveria bassiana]
MCGGGFSRCDAIVTVALAGTIRRPAVTIRRQLPHDALVVVLGQ